MAVNDRTASSRQLAPRWSTVTGVLISASSIRRRLWHHGLRARGHDVRIPVRRYAGERCLPECIIERHSGLTPRVMVCSVISYHGRSNKLRIRQDNARTHIAKTVRDFCSAQHMQLRFWSAYSPDMSPIEHVWDLVGRSLARDPHPAAAKDELLLRIQAIWNSPSQANFQNLFDFMPRHIAALIAAHSGYTKY
ncbi:transposable element Tcb2 transposase [Trichonephila clavipes]|nr:transposable element Tcb2 transposase [Trichonephila clavipes]